VRTDVETAAYFVVSEAVANAVKHAGSAKVAVSLERSDDQLHLEVADDGSGGVRAGGGMRGMADRVQALGGQLAVHSTSGGTRVRAVIPCGS
jgi:signal transduction histidine kinase